MTHPAPIVPPDARVAVRAYPARPRHDLTTLWFTYDVWIVDRQEWTGRHGLTETVRILYDEGLSKNLAGGKLRAARDKVRAIIAAGEWKGSIPDWVEP